MVAITAKGHTVPTRTDPVDIEANFTAFGDSISDLPPVGSLTEANQLATSGAGFPVHVYRTDLHAHEVLEEPGGEWRWIGGEYHYCVAEVSRTVANGTTAELHVNGFKERSEGWATNAGGIVIPKTGIWNLEIYGRIAGILSHNEGRRFFDLKIGSNVHNQKFPLIDDTAGGGSSSKFITAGTTVWFRCYQDTSSSTGGRVVTADITISYLGMPRLVG